MRKEAIPGGTWWRRGRVKAELDRSKAAGTEQTDRPIYRRLSPLLYLLLVAFVLMVGVGVKRWLFDAEVLGIIRQNWWESEYPQF